MTTLVVAEHDNATLKASTLNTVAAAAKIGQPVHVLVAGHACAASAQAAGKIKGVDKVRVVDAPPYAHPLAENLAALVVSMANLFYRDVKYLFEVVLTVWMFATSVVYPIKLIGGRLGAVLALNPMTPIIEGYRAVLLRNELPFTPAFGAATVLALASLALAWVAFHRAEYTFAENI